MHPIYKILLLIKEEYLNRQDNGLCSLAIRISDMFHNPNAKLVTSEVYMFQDYIRDSVSEDHTFYTHNGTPVKDHTQYVWSTDDKDSRIAWLNKHITLNAPE